MHTDENVRAGLSPSEARRQALLKLGGLAAVTESYRDRRGLPWLESTLRTSTSACGCSSKHRGFAATALLTLSLGIGATTAIFTMVDHVVVRPLSYPEAHRLYAVHEEPDALPHRPLIPVNAMHFQEWRRSTSRVRRHGAHPGAGSEPDRFR